MFRAGALGLVTFSIRFLVLFRLVCEADRRFPRPHFSPSQRTWCPFGSLGLLPLAFRGYGERGLLLLRLEQILNLVFSVSFPQLPPAVFFQSACSSAPFPESYPRFSCCHSPMSFCCPQVFFKPSDFLNLFFLSSSVGLTVASIYSDSRLRSYFSFVTTATLSPPRYFKPVGAPES